MATEVEPLFEAEEQDPASEARDAIWTEFEEFGRLAEDLTTQASTLAGSVEAAQDLPPVLQTLGQACSACHDLYRTD